MMKLSFPRFSGRKPAAAPVMDLSPRTEACRFIVDYWRSLRGDRILPRNAEIDPIALMRNLPHVALFEVRTPDLTVCRLAGTTFGLSLGFELTGKNVIHLYGPDLHRAAGYRFWMMAKQPCAALFEMPLRFSTGADAPHEVVVLPLEAEGPVPAPVLLVGTAGIEAVRWQHSAGLPQLNASPSFRFFDIGAGIPASSLPPGDFGR